MFWAAGRTQRRPLGNTLFRRCQPCGVVSGTTLKNPSELRLYGGAKGNRTPRLLGYPVLDPLLVPYKCIPPSGDTRTSIQRAYSPVFKPDRARCRSSGTRTRCPVFPRRLLGIPTQNDAAHLRPRNADWRLPRRGATRRMADADMGTTSASRTLCVAPRSVPGGRGPPANAPPTTTPAQLHQPARRPGHHLRQPCSARPRHASVHHDHHAHPASAWAFELLGVSHRHGLT